MLQTFRRFRIRLRISRRWLYAGALGTAGLALWVLWPFGARGPALELVVLNPDGRYHYEIQVPRVWADTTGTVPGAVVRVPLVLAVRNVGSEAARATRLELSLPARYRLAHGDGKALRGQLMTGTPLVRYGLDVPLASSDPEKAAQRLPALDTLWLEPVIPSFYCVSLADSVPEFVPSPPPAVEAISRIEIFYSFEGGDLEERQTGLLTVHLDPELLEREFAEPPPAYPVQYGHPHEMMPDFSALQYVGARQAFCGEPEDPMELMSSVWETPAGGRFIVLYHGGAPRKYLFDLDGDGIIELEMWDANGDGRFEARRAAQLPIPAFLLPPEGGPVYDVARLDSLPEDSLVWLDRYRGMPYLAYEPQTAPPDTVPQTERFRPRTLGDELDDDAPPGVTRRYKTFGARTDTSAAPPRTRLEPPTTAAPTPAPGQPELRGQPVPGQSQPPQPQTTPPQTPPTLETEPPAAQTDTAVAEPSTDDDPDEVTPDDDTPRVDDRPPPVLRGRPVDSIPSSSGSRDPSR